MNQPALKVAKAKKILIVEDEGDICLLLNIILNGNQTDIDHVNSIAAAKAYLQKEQPSLIMLDNKLPDGLGLDFLEYIKQNYPAIKILMISGFGTSARDLALSNGADHFIEKPFTKQQVSQSVQALLI
jgi:two-component system OmpR family response regulator